jgi:hypothetical protein
MQEDAIRKVLMLVTVAGLVVAGPLFMVSAGAQNAVERPFRQTDAKRFVTSSRRPRVFPAS